LNAAFNNYGELDLVELYTVGEPDTAISLGCNPGNCDLDWLNQKTVDDLRVWMEPSINWYDRFKFNVYQIGGSQTDFVRMLRYLPKVYCNVR